MEGETGNKEPAVNLGSTTAATKGKRSKDKHTRRKVLGLDLRAQRERKIEKREKRKRGKWPAGGDAWDGPAPRPARLLTKQAGPGKIAKFRNGRRGGERTG